MRTPRSKSIWPSLAVLACLVALCATTPRSWQRRTQLQPSISPPAAATGTASLRSGLAESCVPNESDAEAEADSLAAESPAAIDSPEERDSGIVPVAEEGAAPPGSFYFAEEMVPPAIVVAQDLCETIDD